MMPIINEALEEDIDLCDLCGENPEEVLVEDLGVCRACEWKAKRIVWQRRYR